MEPMKASLSTRSWRGWEGRGGVVRGRVEVYRQELH